MHYDVKLEPVARRWRSVSEVAALLGVSSPTLYRAIQEGQFPAVRIRGRLIVPMQAVEEMLADAVSGGRIVDAASWGAAAASGDPATAERRPPLPRTRPLGQAKASA